MYILRLLKRFGFNDDELLSVYKCYVTPIFEYADVAWPSSITVQQRKILEHLQKCACRTILGQRYTTYAAALETFGLESLAEGRSLSWVCRILNVQITSSLLPDWSLTPTTCIMQVITLNCATEHHASKTVQSHSLSTSKISKQTLSSVSSFIILLYHASLNNHCAILLCYYAYIYLF